MRAVVMRTALACTDRVRPPLASNPHRLSIVLALTNIAEADEAYVIGKRGQYTPVGAYLAGDEIIKIAVEHGAQLIHPGKARRPKNVKDLKFQVRANCFPQRLWFLV